MLLRSDHKGGAFLLDEKKNGEGKGVNREENYLVRRGEGQGRAGKSEKDPCPHAYLGFIVRYGFEVEEKIFIITRQYI